MLPNFIVKVTVDERDCLPFNNSLAIQQFRELRSYVIEGVSRDAATLFAEPVVTQKGAEFEIAWYAEPVGQPVPLSQLDPDVRRIVSDKLARAAQALAPLLAGEMGALLSRAFYVKDEDSILAVGQEPVLINWGIVTPDVDTGSQRALNAHFAATLGRYTALPAPTIVRRTFTTRPVATPDLPPPPPRSGSSEIFARHRGLCIATLVIALLALLLAIPGVLGKRDAAAEASLVSVADAKKITEAMQDKVSKARAAVSTATCSPTGEIETPNKQTDIPLRASDQRGDMALVARRATESVVLVLTCVERTWWDSKQQDDTAPKKALACPKFRELEPDAEEAHDLVAYQSGSGFFVAPKTVVTNLHVVDDAVEVFVIGRSLPHVIRATVKAKTAVKTSVDAPDFAVLDVDIAQSPPPIELSTTPTLLQDVVAAGFPGVIIDKDPQLDQLLHGDGTAMPALTTYPGSITLLKGLDSAMPLVFSSAVIAHGNSGGPLMNLCGQAVGMNTLGWNGKEDDIGYKVNVAEGAKALSAFLDDSQIAHTTSTATCMPAPQTALQTPPDNGAKPPAPQLAK